jgi:hypothetical protein
VSKYIETAHRYFVATPVESVIAARKRAFIKASDIPAGVGSKLSPHVTAAHSAEAALKVNAPVA